MAVKKNKPVARKPIIIEQTDDEDPEVVKVMGFEKPFKKNTVTLQAVRFYKNGMIGDGEIWKKGEIKTVDVEIARQLLQDDATAFEIVSK